jgi:hypothetical protein
MFFNGRKLIDSVMKTLAIRLQALAKTMAKFPEFGKIKHEDLVKWVKEELGTLDRLETWHNRVIGIAPRSIYHIAASTLPVSLWQTLLCGLTLGAQNFVKLPSGVDWKPYKRFSEALPKSLRHLVVYEEKFNANQMQAADVVVVMGEDQTLAAIRGQMLPHQRFIGYGTKVSFLCGSVKKLSNRKKNEAFKNIVKDVLQYNHAGCLAPRGIFLAPDEDAEMFCQKLSKALENALIKAQEWKVSRSEALKMQEYRAVAHFKGNPVYPQNLSALRFSLVISKCTKLALTDAPLSLPVVTLSSWRELKLLSGLKNKISTVGCVGESLPAEAQKAWIELGVTRFCKSGAMQMPSIFWKHDGYDTLRPFIHWVHRDQC